MPPPPHSYLEALIPNGMVSGRDQSPLSPPCKDPARRQQPPNQEEGACLSWLLDLGPPSLENWKKEVLIV